MTYADDLKRPEWQKKRLRVLEAANWRCARCGSEHRQLHAHHKIYIKGMRPWDYADELLECLCDPCHNAAHAERDELDWMIAQRPTFEVSMFTDAVASAIAHGKPNVELPPKINAAFREIGAALAGRGSGSIHDAMNALQDAIDEVVDLRRGPGGAWRQAA